MNRERSLAFLTAAALGFLTAWGTVGCLSTAFHLNLEYPAAPVVACAAAALLSAVLFSFRHGGSLLLCLLALAAGYIHQDGTAAEQFLQLIHRLSTIYDRAYGWGVLEVSGLPWDAGFADWPLAITGVLIAAAVTRTILRRSSCWFSIPAVLLPLCSCIVVTDTVPGEIWLLMVMACLVLLLLTANVRREYPAQGIRLILYCAFPVTLALAALFLTNPQNNYVNQSAIFRENILIAAENIPKLMETGMNQIASSLSRQPARHVDLASLGARIPFTYPVMEVTAETSGPLYLRQQDYDLYDGLGWTSSEDRTETFPATSGPGEVISIRTESPKSGLFLPYHPASGSVLKNGSAENPAEALEYTILRNRLPEDWRQTVYQNTANMPQEWQDYLMLPEDTRQGAAEILDGLFSPTSSNTEKAEHIAALVLSTARYDLDPGTMPPSERDFALWFLRESDSGYCIHFATAATVLLRAAGVPARYVTGYLLESAAGEAVTVTEENAHAWAEYYEPNLGVWLPLEATPADEEPVQAVSPQTAPLQATAAPQLQTEPAESVTEVSTTPTLPPETAVSETQQPAPAQPPQPEAQRAFPAHLLLLLMALLILPIQRAARLALRRRRQQAGDPNRQALQRWQESVRLTRLLKESPTEELIILAQKAKFSQYQLTEEELSRFDSFNRTCLHRLKKKPWYLRLIYRFIYAAY